MPMPQGPRAIALSAQAEQTQNCWRTTVMSLRVAKALRGWCPEETQTSIPGGIAKAGLRP